MSKENKVKNIKQNKKSKFTSHINCIGAVDDYLLAYTWSIGFNHSFKHSPKPFTKPRLKQTLKFLGTATR